MSDHLYKAMAEAAAAIVSLFERIERLEKELEEETEHSAELSRQLQERTLQNAQSLSK